MKYILSIVLSFFVIACVVSCNRYDGDSYDLSDKTQHYMRFTSKVPLEDTEANTFTFTLQTRVGFTEDLTVNYSIQLDGQAEMNYTITYPKNTISLPLTYTPPVGTVPATASSIDGVITLKSAVGARTGTLRIGYPETGDETIPITIIKR